MNIAGAQLEEMTAVQAIDMIKTTLDTMVEEGEI